jgi:leucyl aminopeptidase
MKSSVPVHTFSQTISDIQKSSISYHIVLVLTESDILQTREIYNISDTQLAPYLANFARYISASPDSRDYIESDLKNDTVHTEKSMILYIGDARNTKITFLFLAKDTENDDNISAFFRKQKTDLCIVSSTLHTASMYKNILLSVYTYDTYLSKKTKHTYEFYFAIPSPNTNEMKHTQRLIESVYMARDMVNMPPGDCTPIDMVGMIQSLEWKNTKIKIIPKKELETLGCNLLLAVSAGSDKDPYIVVFERISSPASPNVHAFIGK